jgi:NAD(P)-dependent dehydrogenase (short-subunit alcohol dehydrogenase family)
LQDFHRTPEGWEMQFATNFLGHFALTTGLHAALAAASGARIVSVSSSANMMAPVFFDDLHFNFIPYNPWLAYGQSKTANVLMAVEATHRRYFRKCSESGRDSHESPEARRRQTRDAT